jgi:hypothetical protein
VFLIIYGQDHPVEMFTFFAWIIMNDWKPSMDINMGFVVYVQCLIRMLLVDHKNMIRLLSYGKISKQIVFLLILDFKTGTWNKYPLILFEEIVFFFLLINNKYKIKIDSFYMKWLIIELSHAVSYSSLLYLYNSAGLMSILVIFRLNPSSYLWMIGVLFSIHQIIFHNHIWQIYMNKYISFCKNSEN